MLDRRRLLAFILAISCWQIGCAVSSRVLRSKTSLYKEKAVAYSMYLRANAASLDGDDVRALSILVDLSRQYPDSAYIHYKLALQYVALEKYSVALSELEKALEIKEDFVDALLVKGEVYSIRGKHTKSIECYERVLSLDPRRHSVYLELAKEYLRIKKPESSIEVLRRYIKMDPNEADGYYYLGLVYAGSFGDFKKAHQMYRKALEVNPDYTAASMAIVDVYLERGDKISALEELRKLEDKLPGEVGIMLKIALLCYELKRYDDAILEFKKILVYEPQLDKIRYYLGLLYEITGRAQNAIAEFEIIPARSDYFRKAQLHLLFLYQKEGKLDSQRVLLEKAIEQRPDIEQFYQLLARLLAGDQKYGEALRVVKEGLKHHPRSERLNFIAGMLYDGLKEYDKAIFYMRRVLEINEKNASALNYIGYTYAEKGINLDEAEELIKRALSIKPKDGYITDSLGWVYFKKGKIDEALKWIKSAYHLVRKEPTITEHLGDVYMKLGNMQEALRYFREALRLVSGGDRDNAEAVDRLTSKIRALVDE